MYGVLCFYPPAKVTISVGYKDYVPIYVRIPNRAANSNACRWYYG